MSRSYYYLAFSVLMGWWTASFFQIPPITYSAETAEGYLPCDSVTLACTSTAVELLPVYEDGDSTSILISATLAAEDLVESPSYACPGNFSVNLVGEANDPVQDLIFFDCQDEGINELEVWWYSVNGDTHYSAAQTDSFSS